MGKCPAPPALNAPTGANMWSPPGPGAAHPLQCGTQINDPLPAISSLSPSPAIAGNSAFTLTVTGSNFVSSSTVQWNGSPRTTTFVSNSSLQSSITAADVFNTGSASITVTTPAPGGGTSNTLTLPINNPVPALTSLNPSSVIVGSGALTLTVSGSNFVSSSVVRWNRKSSRYHVRFQYKSSSRHRRV